MITRKKTTNPTSAELTIASSVIVIVGLVAMGAWFNSSDTLLKSVIQTGLAWCF